MERAGTENRFIVGTCRRLEEEDEYVWCCSRKLTFHFGIYCGNSLLSRQRFLRRWAIYKSTFYLLIYLPFIAIGALAPTDMYKLREGAISWLGLYLDKIPKCTKQISKTSSTRNHNLTVAPPDECL